MPEHKPCPNCGEKIERDAILCKYCGLNVETGESYSARMERAKSYRKETGSGRKSLAFGLFILFATVLAAGFIYHKRMTKAIEQSPEKYIEFASVLQKADRLIAKQDYASAREQLKSLQEQLEEEREEFQQKDDSSESEQYNHENRTLISNLAAKTSKKLARLPSHEKEETN